MIHNRGELINCSVPNMVIDPIYKLEIDDLKIINSKTSLTTLDIWRNNIGNEGALVLSKNKTITTLNIGGNYIKNEEALTLSENKTIT